MRGDFGQASERARERADEERDDRARRRAGRRSTGSPSAIFCGDRLREVDDRHAEVALARCRPVVDVLAMSGWSNPNFSFQTLLERLGVDSVWRRRAAAILRESASRPGRPGSSAGS